MLHRPGAGSDAYCEPSSPTTGGIGSLPNDDSAPGPRSGNAPTTIGTIETDVSHTAMRIRSFRARIGPTGQDGYNARACMEPHASARSRTRKSRDGLSFVGRVSVLAFAARGDRNGWRRPDVQRRTGGTRRAFLAKRFSGFCAFSVDRRFSRGKLRDRARGDVERQLI